MTTPEQAFDALAALPFSEIYLALILQASDPFTGKQQTFYVSNAPRLYTEPEDAPPNVGFRNVIMKGWSLSRRLSQRGVFTGPSTYNTGSVTINDSSGDLKDWPDLDWNDQPFSARVGGRIQADGSPYPFRLYRSFFEGVTEDVVRTSDGNLELILRGRSVRLDGPVVSTFYRGFGGAVKSTDADALRGTDTAILNLSDGMTLEWFGQVDALPAVEGTFLRRGLDYGLHLANDGEFGFLHNNAVLGSGHRLVAGPEPVYVAAAVEVVKAGFLVRMYAGRTAVDIVEVGSGTIATLPMTAGDLVFGRVHSNGFAWRCWEARLWKRARTERELIDNADAPLIAPKEQLKLAEVWKFGDGSGTIARGSRGAVDLTLKVAQSFESSLEGDDPEQFIGGAIGKSKGRLYGPGNNVLLTPVDSQRHDYQWSDGASGDLPRVYVRGAPMVPKEKVTAAAAGEIQTDGTKDAITVSVASGFTGHRFVPGQRDPLVPGQRIEIASSGVADGIYRIKVDGILDEGRQILVESDSFNGPAALPTASLPAGTLVRTPAGDVQYTYNLTTSTVRTKTVPDGDLTADAIGLLSQASGSTVSEIFELLVGDAVDSSGLTFNPRVGLFVPPGSGMTLKEAMDGLMRSAVGWWIENRDGSYRLGNFLLPSGSPVATLAGSKLSELDPENVAPIVGRIKTMEPVRTKTPAWQLKVGWGRTWHVQQPDALVGSVPPARRLALGETFRFAVRTFGSVRKRYPTSTPLDPFETYLVDRKDAKTFLDLAAPLFTQKRAWWDVDVVGLSMLSVDLHDVVFLQHPHPSFGLTEGVLGRVLAQDENAESDLVSLEIFH